MNTVQELLKQWDVFLEQQTPATLKKRENGTGWTMGQLYMHLIQSTVFFSKQINSCLASDLHQDASVTPKGAYVLKAGSLPNTRIEGPASNNATPEPESPEFLHDSLQRLIEKFGKLEAAIGVTEKQGKAPHPGDLGYFTAAEWLQFTGMHLKHHFRQYERIMAGSLT